MVAPKSCDIRDGNYPTSGSSNEGIKMERGMRIGLAALWTLCAAINFGVYFAKADNCEAQMLRSTGEYVQMYEGEAPSEVLDYAHDTVRLVVNSDAGIEEASELETTIAEAKADLQNVESQRIYGPVLDDIGEKMEDVGNDYTPNAFSLGLGVMNIGLAAFYSFSDD